MIRKKIKINFIDFYPDFSYQDFFIYKFLCRYYDVSISENPDYLFCSCFGYRHWKYRECIKIYFTAENLIPDFNIYDYGIGFHYLSLEDRYLRFPLWLLYSWDQLENMENKEIELSTYLFKRNFCNFVYSNNGGADPIREYFYKELSRYKKIDSGGGYLNNIGYRVPNKLLFIKDYKFTIAIENSVVPGYTTEKIIEPMMVNSVPIYYGDPYVSRDFNMESCVHLRDYPSIKESIEHILFLDENEEAYLSKLKQKWFSKNDIKKRFESELYTFLSNIIEKDKDQASRLTNFGFSKRYRKEMSRTTPWANTFFVEKLYGLKDRLKNGKR